MRLTLKIFYAVSVLFFFNYCSFAEAQDNKDITGIVTAFKNIPLNNVKIIALRSGEKTITNSFGQFVIKSSGNDVLSVSASGFKEKKIKVKKGAVYNINLSYIFCETCFDEATRNGHITEAILREAINATSSSKGKDYSKYKSIYELISSEIYNVRVKGTSVYNTKVRSFDPNPQVLFVVDNVIVSDISYISPEYVKNIEFIDDVGASAYGVKGANGIIKITLK
jgi:hypothetical protein